MKDIFGFRSNQVDIVGESAIQATKGNYAPFAQKMNMVDFHQDLPLSQGNFYVAADALFPGSKFILTTRHKEGWVKSFISFYADSIFTIVRDDWGRNHSRGRYPSFCASWINYHYAFPLRNLKKDISISCACEMNNEELLESICKNLDFTDSLSNLFVNRNREIKHYFCRRPNDLLEIDWEQTPTVKTLVEFLGIPDFLQIENVPKINSQFDGRSGAVKVDCLTDFSSRQLISFLKIG
jgi:hypothetical protein